MSSMTIDSMVDLKQNYVEYGGNKYFRRNAHKIALCSHGRKSDSVLATNYMQITAKIANRHLENVIWKSKFGNRKLKHRDLENR